MDFNQPLALAFGRARESVICRMKIPLVAFIIRSISSPVGTENKTPKCFEITMLIVCFNPGN